MQHLRTAGLLFLAIILIVLYPTMNAELQALDSAVVVEHAIQILAPIGVLGAILLCLSLATYEEIWRKGVK